MKNNKMEMKFKYLKWCMENEKEMNEQTMMEFFENFEKEMKQRKTTIAEVIAKDERLSQKVDGVFGFTINDDGKDNEASMQFFGQGHAHKPHVAKALLVMVDTMLLDNKFEDMIGDVDDEMLQYIQFMFVAMIKSIWGKEKEETVSQEKESKHIC